MIITVIKEVKKDKKCTWLWVLEVPLNLSELASLNMHMKYGRKWSLFVPNSVYIIPNFHAKFSRKIWGSAANSYILCAQTHDDYDGISLKSTSNIFFLYLQYY